MNILNEQIQSVDVNSKQRASFYANETTWAMFVFNKIKQTRVNNWAWKCFEYIFSGIAEGKTWIIFQGRKFSMTNARLEFLYWNPILSTNWY